MTGGGVDPAAPTASSSGPPARNPGAALDLDWALEVTIDEGAIATSAAELDRSPHYPPARLADRLLQALCLIDLTTLAGDDTPETVGRLCARALQPLPPGSPYAPASGAPSIRPAAVCVYPFFIPVALEALRGSGVRVATVAAGFPHGLSPLRQRIDEVRACADAGAAEIDVVIARTHVLTGDWRALYDEVKAFREACGDAHLKVILATGELGSLTHVARASRVSLLAGADFIKTSTGKESVNATIPAGIAMAGAIRDYRDRTGHRVGLKPAGGIRTAEDALRWLAMVEGELGGEWAVPDLFRLGASSLLDDIARALAHVPPPVGEAISPGSLAGG